MHDVKLRGARAADAREIADLSGQLGYPATEEAIAQRLGRLLGRKEDTAVFVAELEDEVVGWIAVGVLESVENDPFAEIRGLVVREEHRGAGIGARLVAAAEAWAGEKGLLKIRVRSNLTRERTHRFYERLGYAVTKGQKVFDRLLRSEER